MLPAHLYTPLYHHTMLLVVFACALVYWAGQKQAASLALFNQVAMIVLGVGMLVLIGSRPVSTLFVDMPNYAWDYERLQQGVGASYQDGLFNVLMQLCSPLLPVEGFFFVCALLYIAPLAWASWRVHGAWAFPVFLACVTALSFWAYGVNGVRNGMATSVLILAFAFHDKPLVMLALMVAACGLHGSVLVPAGAFLLVRYSKRTEIWLAFWGVSVVASLFGGNIGAMLFTRYNPLASDARAESYIHSVGSGFRADFLAYSILPILATLLLAAPTRAGARRLATRVMRSPVIKGLRNRGAMTAKKMSMGRGRLAVLPASPVGSLALAGFGPLSADPRTAPGAALSTLNSPVLRSSTAEGGQPSTRILGRPGKTMPSAWARLPWVQLLRTDAFYARLVNTYLLANALWILVINTSFSNRFAYLSWFMMPWALLYPFVPGQVIHRPRTGLIAATLVVQYLFTYVMYTVVYRLRGIQ